MGRDIEQVRKWHEENGASFRLKCMIGREKGLARKGDITPEQKQKHLMRASELQNDLDNLKG
jgi:hypothetical protein